MTDIIDCHASESLTSNITACLERLPFLRVDLMGSLIRPRRRQVSQRPGLYRSCEQDHDPRAQLVPRLPLILHLLVPPVHDDLS